MNQTPKTGPPRVANPAVLVRPELRALPAYHLEQTACRWKLDQNEVPWELPRRLKQAVAAALVEEPWARYPDFHADALRRELGALHAWPWEGVLVGNGSNELLALALEGVAQIGGEVLTPEPCFGLYRMFIQKAGAHPVFLPPRPDLALPMEELLAEVERVPERPVLLCTPNNPTGASATVEQVEALLERMTGPLLLDNAYAEFCRHDYRPLLARYPNLLIFRTFSKAWSLAGLRLGYLLADPRLVAELIKIKLPYNLNRASAAAGRAALEAEPAAARRVRTILGRRPQWAERLAAAGLEVFSSEANFLLVRAAGEDEAARLAAAKGIRDGLAERGILVRDVGAYPGLGGCLRVSVGSGGALRAVSAAFSGGRVSSVKNAGEDAGGPRTIDRVGEGFGVRVATVARSTKETQINLTLSLDGGGRRIGVPNGFFGHMLEALSTHGGFGIDLEAAGDTQVDLHHTVEDVGIAMGEALASVLGERRGLVRFSHAYAPLDEALARAVVDLSGRGSFHWSVPPELADVWVTAEFPLSLVADFFAALADRGRLTLHLDVLSARNGHHAAEAAFKAAALALRQAVAIRAGSSDVPSTKGTLSV
ncbi:MAG TPA: aminotransferase class I/II-fold pyridoxal phosphate-dependent enzyme [Thermoanaerobaculia bacterium]|jgi:histidinol-phosphate aminotransferase|nr:aminotransferase class I/II-fold pyridoxal phosphate-dependent enzyme [Thermoanaerobaculia bacterium]